MSTTSPFRERKVALTGVTGFVAGHICEQLLRHNAENNGNLPNDSENNDLFTIHCTVRDISKKERYAFIEKIAEKYYRGPERLKFFQSDLLKPGSFDEAFQGCEEVIHSAAITDIRFDTCPFKDVIMPGVEGAKEVAKACQRTPSVKRIVLTCSGNVVDMEEDERIPELRGKPLQESEMKLDLRPRYNPYVVEKVLAEKVMPENFTRGTIISMLPTLIIGPLQNKEIKSSMNLIKFIANREASMTMPFYASWIDARDVGNAHRMALDMKIPEEVLKTGERLRRVFVTSKEMISAVDIAKSMNKTFPKLNAPETVTPAFLLWIASCCDERLTDYVRLFLSKPRAEASQERMINELKFTRKYPNLDETLKDTVLSMVEFGIVDPKKVHLKEKK